MRKHHFLTLKFHTVYTLILAALFLTTIIIFPDVTLFLAALFLILYVAGNGIIHARKNQLTRDSIIEYGIVAVVALVVLLGALI